MKLLTSLGIALVLVLSACKKEAPAVVETTAAGEKYSYYGEKIEADDAMDMEKLLDYMKGKDNETVKVSGEILQTCIKKGCWMDVAMPGAEPMKVRFKDYGFFVPTEGAEGKTAIMEGRAFVDTMSVDVLKHYAEDAGQSQEEIDQITEPKEVLAFEATGVMIKEPGE